MLAAPASTVKPKKTEFILVNSCSNSIRLIKMEQTYVIQHTMMMKL